MKKITVQVGSIVVGNSGQTNDTRRDVQFVGEELASHTEYGTHHGNITDTRGVTEKLYRTADGRLLVHSRDWSQWRGEPNVYTLREITEADLQPNGRYEALGREAGYGRPLTIDEALSK